jgi:hypothetical protein
MIAPVCHLAIACAFLVAFSLVFPIARDRESVSLDRKIDIFRLDAWQIDSNDQVAVSDERLDGRHMRPSAFPVLTEEP